MFPVILKCFASIVSDKFLLFEQILFGHCISFSGTLAETSVSASLVTRPIFPELNVRGPAKSAFYYLRKKYNVRINAKKEKIYLLLRIDVNLLLTNLLSTNLIERCPLFYTNFHF